LDAVEVVMAIEEVRVVSPPPTQSLICLSQEFAIEIPDAEADEIKTVQHGRPPSLIV
jgi:acyl carrier protein